MIQNASVALADADTPVAGATQIAHGVVSAGNRTGGIIGRENEIILKNNTIYCLRAVALSAGWVSFDMGWYEHYPHRITYYI